MTGRPLRGRTTTVSPINHRDECRCSGASSSRQRGDSGCRHPGAGVRAVQDQRAGVAARDRRSGRRSCGCRLPVRAGRHLPSPPRPLERLSRRMADADVLLGRFARSRPERRRGRESSSGRSTRCSTGSSASAATAAAAPWPAPEGERPRIARGLHDEVGQTMTGVLLQLTRLRAGRRRRRSGGARGGPARRRDEPRGGAADRPGAAAADARAPRAGLSALTDLWRRRFARAHRARRRAPLRPGPARARPRRRGGRLPGRAGEPDERRPPRRRERTCELDARAAARQRACCASIDDGRGFANGQPAEGGGLRGMRERAVSSAARCAVKPAASRRRRGALRGAGRRRSLTADPARHARS